MHEIKQVTVTPTITLNAYTANDVVGGLMTFTFTEPTFDGAIRSVLVTDAANQSEGYTLYIFNELPSTIANDAPFAPVIADLKKIATTVTVAAGDYTSVNSLAWALLGGHEDAQMEIFVHSNTGKLYMYAEATSTPDYAAVDDLAFKIALEIFHGR